jgi:hypothetical protein
MAACARCDPIAALAGYWRGCICRRVIAYKAIRGEMVWTCFNEPATPRKAQIIIIQMFRVGPGSSPLLVCTFAVALAAQTLPPPARTKVDFARDIQPLLAKRCQLCHGPQQQMKGLRLDQKDSALKVVQPGNSAESRGRTLQEGGAGPGSRG